MSNLFVLSANDTSSCKQKKVPIISLFNDTRSCRINS